MARDGVHGREDGSNERTAQQPTMGEHRVRDIFKRDGRREKAGLLGRQHVGAENGTRRKYTRS